MTVHSTLNARYGKVTDISHHMYNTTQWSGPILKEVDK